MFKVRRNQVYVGDIKICTLYKKNYKIPDGGFSSKCCKVIEERALLLKAKNGRYIDLKYVNLLGLLRFYTIGKNDSSIDKTCKYMLDKASWEDQIYVDGKSVEPYFTGEDTKEISFKELKSLVKKR